MPARHRHLSRPLPGAPALQPPAWETARSSADAAIRPPAATSADGVPRNLPETFRRGFDKPRPRASVRNVTGSWPLRRSASTGWLPTKGVSSSPSPRRARATRPVATPGARPERAAGTGGRLRPMAALSGLARRVATTHDLHYVCSPTPLRRADLDGLEASSRCGDLGSIRGEHEPSCATVSWTLPSQPTSRAASTTCAPTSPVRAFLTSDRPVAFTGVRRDLLRPWRIISSPRDRSGHHALLLQRKEARILSDLARGPAGAVVRWRLPISQRSFQISCAHRTLPNTPKSRVTAYMSWRGCCFLFREGSVSVMRDKRTRNRASLE